MKTEDAVEDDAGVTTGPAEPAPKEEEEKTHEVGEDAAVGPTQTENPNPTTAKVGVRKKALHTTTTFRLVSWYELFSEKDFPANLTLFGRCVTPRTSRLVD